jgi:hypothetical protein
MTDWRPEGKGGDVTDDELFDQIGAAVEARGGWHYEPASTPGLEPSWCLDPGGEVVVSVNVVDGKVVVYLPAEDRELSLAGVDGLVKWLDLQEGLTGAG